MVNDQLLTILVNGGKMTEEQAETALQDAVKNQQAVEDYLATNNLVGQEDLAEGRGKLYNIPYIDLAGKQVDVDVLKLIPEETASHYQVVAFQKSETEVNVGIVDPRNFKALEAVEFLMKEQNLQPFYYIISPSNYASILKNYSALGEEVGHVLEVAKDKFDIAEESDDLDIEGGDIGEVLKKAPVSKIVSIIIKHAVDLRASDIHIEPEKEQSRVRYRIDGIMLESLQLPAFLHNSVITRIKVLAEMQLDETRKPQDGRISLKFGKQDVNLRVSTLPLVGSEKVVMRILDTSGKVPMLKDLGYTERNAKMITASMKRSHGMVLVTGPTGSGKSTSLYSVLNILNEGSVNIVTLEDPAEFYIPGVNQSQVNPDVGFTFSSGLRAMLRQDPDIIMVGEIRDLETAELAINASLTGHLMFSTLHTSNALGAIPRLADMGVEPYLLSATLAALIAQRLVRKICEHCKVDLTLPPELEAKVREQLNLLPDDLKPKELADKKPLVFYKGNGCTRCGDTGYKGRTSVAEVIVAEDNIKQLIADAAGVQALEKMARENGTVFMQQDGFLRALLGITTVEEILRVMQE
jgi:type IV pilus assembly protein PilB